MEIMETRRICLIQLLQLLSFFAQHGGELIHSTDLLLARFKRKRKRGVRKGTDETEVEK